MSANMSHLTTRLTAFLASGALASACGAQIQPEGVERSTLADTAMVVNWTPSIADTASLSLTLRIGLIDGPAEYTFGPLWAVAALRSGIIVFDARAGLLGYDHDGKFVRLLGGLGEGPSEVLFVRGMTEGPAGELAILDAGNRKVMALKPDGSLETWRMTNGTPRYGEDVVRFLDDGSLWQRLDMTSAATGPERPLYVRVGGPAGYGDTITAPRGIRECHDPGGVANRIGYWEDRRSPWQPVAEYALGRDGAIVYGCPASYEFYIRSADGSVMKVARAWDPVQLSDEQRAFVRDIMLRGQAAPSLRPAYARLIRTDDGRTWVLTNTALAANENSPGAWVPPIAGGALDVFEPDGRWYGTVRLPSEVLYSGFPSGPMIWIRGDTIWAGTRDEIGVQYVSRYQVAWPTPD